MRVVKHSILFIFIISVKFAFSQETRFEIGTDYTIKKFNIGLEAQLRKPSLIKNDYLGLFQAEVEYEICKQLDFEVGYRFKTDIEEFYPESHIDYNSKHRFTFDLGYNAKRFDNDIKLKNTVRYQTNFSQNEKRKNYLRNEFELNYKLTNKFEPYIAPSIYYNLDKKHFSEFRIEIGSGFELGKNSIDVFYIIELDVLGVERTRYILGLAYGVSF